ncbi:MAG: galactose mutarotase [Clostridia bacterium]|nr:galactose mutarotase [Clostridia bacterium]
MTNIFEKPFGIAGGRAARLFMLESEDLSVGLTDLGCTLVFVRVKAAGVNAVLGYPDAGGYARGTSCVGASVGRYAGRIGNARFTLNGREYALERNDGENHLHGGFHKRFYDAEPIENGVRFSLTSPDMDEGFPGELRLTAEVTLNGSALRFVYGAESSADTYINITNHSYFNLDGGGDVKAHALRVNAEKYAELGPGMIPTGRLLPVSGTPLDFTEMRRIGDISAVDELSACGGLDHSFALENGGSLALCAEAFSPKTGVRLICRTTQPCVHVYTGNFINLDAAGSFPKNGGFCLETQHFPDSPNKPEFPPALLRAGERFRETTEYEFLCDT